MAVKDVVAELVEPIISKLGYELVEVTYQKMYDAMHLTIYIDCDKEGGVSLDDTELVANAIDAPLDSLDPTAGESYVLNVSSPGLDRPLKTEKDFNRKIGTEVEVSLYAPIGGSKKHVGVLKGYNDGVVSLSENGNDINIALKDISVVKPYIKF